MRGKNSPSTRLKVFSALFTATFISLLIAGVLSTSNDAVARSGKGLRGDTYVTPSGATIEIVEVPGFGKCLISASNTICEGGKE